MSIQARQRAHVCLFSHDLAAAETFQVSAYGLTKTLDFTT